MPVRPCPATYLLWEVEGDSLEVQCELGVEPHDQHEGTVSGSAAFTDSDLVIELPARLTWPAQTKVTTP